MPDALLALSNDRLNEGCERFGEVGVYKTAIGTHGGGTWKVDLTERVNPKVGNRQAFLQRLIDRDDEKHRDLRVYVVGDEIVGSMYRYAPEGDWRTNVALGGAVEDATDDMPQEAAETALYAAEVMGLDYAGVDLVIGIGGNQHTVTASVEDRGHMEYPLLLGRDILTDYRVDVRKRADVEEAERDEAGEILEEE